MTVDYFYFVVGGSGSFICFFYVGKHLLYAREIFLYGFVGNIFCEFDTH